MPPGHRFNDDTVVHAGLSQRVAGGFESDPLWLVIEAGEDGAGVIEPAHASLFGSSEGLTLAELDDLIEALERGRAALAEILGASQ